MDKSEISQMIKVSIGKWLMAQRLKSRKSLDEAAEHLHRNRHYLEGVENGVASPLCSEFARLVIFYGVPQLKVVRLFCHLRSKIKNDRH